MIVLRKAIIVILGLIAQQQAEMKNFKPLDELTGTDTGIDRQFSLMITDQKQMLQMWQEHKQILGDAQSVGNITIAEAQVPKVDFKKNVVFVFFAGQNQGINGWDVASVDTKGKTAIINIAPQRLTDALVSNSFGMWVFPKPTKPVDLNVVIGMNNGKPVTKMVGHFEPPKVQKDSKTSGGTSTGS